MRVYISADMEGICGVSGYEDVNPSSPRFERALKLMEWEVGKVCEILFDNGVKDITVNDAHWNMNNLRIENLPKGVKLISGSPKSLSMMEGIDGGYDFCIFIGYHSSSTTLYGHLAHTYSSRTVKSIRINGEVCSEAYINSLISGSFGVPLALISGDKKLAEDERERLKGVEFVITKEGLGFNPSILYHPEKVLKDYEEKIGKILKGNGYLPNMPESFLVEVEFKDIRMADVVGINPYVKRLDAYKVSFEERDFIRAFKFLRSLIVMASTV
ncbi:MAG: M55 family metallopeptidase [candidate division WOR-3 bacterium]